jgi:hypothetical protein
MSPRILSYLILLAILAGALIMLVPEFWSSIILGGAALIYIARTERRMEELEIQLEQVEELILGANHFAK